jgi:hypothetical protein
MAILAGGVIVVLFKHMNTFSNIASTGGGVRTPCSDRLKQIEDGYIDQGSSLGSTVQCGGD